MFLRMDTQWIIGGMGTLVGLNYSSMEFLFRIYKVSHKKQKQLFEDVHAIELAALKIIRGRESEK